MEATAYRSRVTEEWSFLVLCLSLVSHPSDHAAKLSAPAWAFILT
jgi:hypothetical protein